MNWLEIISLSAIVIVFVLSPGPGAIALIVKTLSSGYMAAVWLGIGLILGDSIYLLAIVISLGTMADTIAPFMLYIRILGGIYLAYIGFKQLSAPAIQKLAATKLKHSDIIKSLSTGFLISGTNPKVMVFYLSLLPLFVDLKNLDLRAGVEVVIVVLISLLIAVLLIVLGSSLLARLLDRPSFSIYLNRITGSLMILIGGLIAIG